MCAGFIIVNIEWLKELSLCLCLRPSCQLCGHVEDCVKEHFHCKPGSLLKIVCQCQKEIILWKLFIYNFYIYKGIFFFFILPFNIFCSACTKPIDKPECKIWNVNKQKTRNSLHLFILFYDDALMMLKCNFSFSRFCWHFPSRPCLISVTFVVKWFIFLIYFWKMYVSHVLS